MSIGMPGGSACKEACIAAGIMVAGAWERRNENRVHRGVECVMGMGAE
jgi:hypothetical protein